jgi:undecaprenyl-diphosphatase
MSYIDAIILGLVQGLTEFIPVSSSGHLVIASQLLGMKDAFTFDTMLNFGTLAALLIFYRKRVWDLIKRVFAGRDWTLAGQLIAATVPAVIIGFTLSSQIERLNTMIWVVIFMLISVGILMVLIGKPNKDADDRELEQSISWPTAIKIGLAQTVALIPGTSRSGITILTGLRLNLSAARAAEFSFMLAIPVLAGGSLKVLASESGKLFIQQNTGQFIVGNLVAFASGMLAIGFLIKWLGKRGLQDFGWYRIASGILLAILLVTGIITV